MVSRHRETSDPLPGGAVDAIAVRDRPAGSISDRNKMGVFAVSRLIAMVAWIVVGMIPDPELQIAVRHTLKCFLAGNCRSRPELAIPALREACGKWRASVYQRTQKIA
jgi:hypothetical protein